MIEKVEVGPISKKRVTDSDRRRPQIFNLHDESMAYSTKEVPGFQCDTGDVYRSCPMGSICGRHSEHSRFPSALGLLARSAEYLATSLTVVETRDGKEPPLLGFRSVRVL